MYLYATIEARVKERECRRYEHPPQAYNRFFKSRCCCVCVVEMQRIVIEREQGKRRRVFFAKAARGGDTGADSKRWFRASCELT